MIFQEPMTALNPVMTCGAQIDELLVQHTRMSGQERSARALQMLEHVRLPDPARIYAAYPHQLSGGQRQRIMIAIALILKPALLIADEPTTALDVTTQAEILRLIRDLQRESGTAVLFITHDFGVVAEIADSVAVLRLGELVESGPARQVLTSPQHAYTRMLLAAVPGLTPRKQPLPDSTDRCHAHARRSPRCSKVAAGFASAAQCAPPTQSISRSSAARRWASSANPARESRRSRACSRGSSSPALATSSWTGTRSQACEARKRMPSGARCRWCSRIPTARSTRAVPSARPSPKVRSTSAQALPAAWKRAGDLMELVKLSPGALKRYPHEFSGGQRQRICIARALAVEPEVLIADEAVSALDVSVQAQILELLDDIQQRLRLTMVFITHDLRVAAQICNRIVVMQHGRVVEQGPVAEVFDSPRHAYTRALLAAAPGRGFRFGAAPG